LRRLRQRSTVAALVHQDGPSKRRRSILSLRREQSRQSAGAGGVSARRRTAATARRTGSPLDRRLRRADHADRGLRRRSVALAALGPDRGAAGEYTAANVEQTVALAAARVRAVEPDAERDDVHHHRYRGDSTAVGGAAGTLLTHVR